MLKKRYENIKFTNNNLKEKDYLDNLIYATNLEEKIQEYFESNNQKRKEQKLIPLKKLLLQNSFHS